VDQSFHKMELQDVADKKVPKVAQKLEVVRYLVSRYGIGTRGRAAAFAHVARFITAIALSIGLPVERTFQADSGRVRSSHVAEGRHTSEVCHVVARGCNLLARIP
jgi:hypothetical protein